MIDVGLQGFDVLNASIDYDTIVDTIDNEINDVFLSKKRATQKLAYIYKRLNYDAKCIKQVMHCGDYLEWIWDSTGKSKLVRGNFCKDKLCPMCAKRRSLKLYHQLYNVVESLHSKYDFLFLTLTVPNCDAKNLKKVCDDMQTAFSRKFMRYIKIDRAFKGCFRALEITVDTNEYITRDMYYGNRNKHLKSKKTFYDKLGLSVGDKNPNYMMYHPHYHCIIAVDKDYWTSDKYLEQNTICKMWTKAVSGNVVNSVTHLPYVCDVRKCFDKNNKDDVLSTKKDISVASAVAEVAKYSVKSSDYLNSTNTINDKVVDTLNTALLHRRMYAFYGIMADEPSADINDAINGDLVVVDGSKIDVTYAVARILYRWDGHKYVIVYIEQLSQRQQINDALMRAGTGKTVIDISCGEEV